MPINKHSIAEIAKETDLDTDEVLIKLWDAGLNHLVGPEDVLNSESFRLAKRALGIPTRRTLKTAKHWMEIFNIDEEKLSKLLSKLRINIKPPFKNLPNNAVKRLRKEAYNQGINPNYREHQRLKIRQQIKEPPFEWHTPGHTIELKLLSEVDVNGIHISLVKDFAKSNDPIAPPGIRDENIFASAIFRPHTSIGNTLKYPTIETSAATLLHAIINNHPFYNGNKRTGLVSMLVFLDKNGFMLICSEDELFKLVLQIAQHKLIEPNSNHRSDREVLAIANWLNNNTRRIEAGDRSIPWRKLRSILSAFDCEFKITKNKKTHITRKTKINKYFRFKATETLSTQITYRSDGSDIPINIIKKIREDLHLDEYHAIDSYAFYGQVPNETADFIRKYSKTLKRLARY